MKGKIQRLGTGKYRYRGHMVWLRDFRYWCSPDPSDWPTWKWTLRGVVKYIDDWEAAFEEGRVYGNMIGMSEETAQQLIKQLTAFNKAVAAQARTTRQLCENMTEMLKSFDIEKG